jgi:hypothetical protein
MERRLEMRENSDSGSASQKSPITRREFIAAGGAVSAACLFTNPSGFELSPSFEKALPAKAAVDHLVLGVADLDQGIAWVEKMTGVKAVVGGTHPGAGTRNALLSLGGAQYLEIIAPDPAQNQTIGRFGDLRQLTTPHLITWAAATKAINTVAEKARAAGYEIDGPRDGSRARPDGKVLKWKSMSIRNEIGGVIPFFIEWDSGTIHPAKDSPQGCRLLSLEIEHEEPAKVRELLNHLGIEARVKHAPEARLKAALASPKGKVALG